MVIIKRDGTKEEFNADKIFNALAKHLKLVVILLLKMLFEI